MGSFRRLLVALAWLAIAVFVAVGSAGVVTSLNHPPSTAERPELTWTGDAAAAAALDATTAKLQALSDAVDALGGSSKTALATLVAGDVDQLTKALDKGTKQLVTVSAAAEDLRAALDAVPFQGDSAALHVSAATIARFRQLEATPALTANLESDWQVLSARAVVAAGVPAILTLHDQQTAAAATQGEAGHYAQALALLDAPDATIVRARNLAESLSKTADVSTLTEWIDRHAAYDQALRALYGAMVSSKGKVTAAVKAAFAQEEAAKAALPTSTKGIVVIMGDIARGGMSQVVIDIEVARGTIANALAISQASSSPSAPEASPGDSASPGTGSSPGASGAAPSGSPEKTPPP